MVRLTDEEILKIIDGNWSMTGNDALCPEAIAKAQLKKVVEWIEYNRINGVFKLDNKWQFRSQFDCDEWQALLKETE